MRGNNVMGIIFSNLHENLISQLTELRTMGAVPFGGRYRLIDFPLSNMVNSGINKVGVITKTNYQSLTDHLGAGKAWDLSRQRNGLFILPPFMDPSDYANRVKTFNAIMPDNADITLVYKRDVLPPKLQEPTVLSFDAKGRVNDVLIDPDITGSCSYYMNIMLIKRELLMKLVNQCISKNTMSFKRDIIQGEYKNLAVYGYEFKGFAPMITSMSDYFSANMALKTKEVRDDLFNSSRPIYTKVRDDRPTKYGLGSKVSNSLIGNGCNIEGEVDNCILFKGVHIGKGTKVSNCVIMQDTRIGNNCNLSYVVVDKDVIVRDDKTLAGQPSYPVYIGKLSVV